MISVQQRWRFGRVEIAVLFTDEQVNPTTMLVTETYTLPVVYRLHCYLSLQTGTVSAAVSLNRSDDCNPRRT
jgi:hypothetical protein